MERLNRVDRKILEVLQRDGRLSNLEVAGRVNLSPSAHVDTIFDAFYTTKANGLGMGLPICRQIAQLHRGSLSLDPQSGGGATFRLSLPPRPQ